MLRLVTPKKNAIVNHQRRSARVLVASIAALAFTYTSGFVASPPANARGDIPVVIQVTRNTSGDVFDPRMRSQDGERITFVSNGDVMGTGTAPGHTEVYLYEIASKAMTRVTNTPQAVVGTDGLGSWDAARSSDDIFASGRPEVVTFVSRGDFDPSVGNADANPEIFLWELGTGTFHQLTNTLPPVENRDPWISDSGKCIAFSSSGDLDNNDGSDSGNPGTGYTNPDGSFEVFLYSVTTSTNFPEDGNFTQVSNGPAGTTSSRPVTGGYIFGRQCQTTAYVSDYDQLGINVAGSHIFLYDRDSGTTEELFAPKETPWGIQPGDYLYPHISSASQFARGPFVVFQTNADLWRNGSAGFEIFRYRVFHPRQTQYTDILNGSVERPVISDGGGYITFQSNGEILDPRRTLKKGGAPPFNADGNYEIFRMRGRRKVAQITRTEGCDNTLPSTSDDGQTLAFRSTCDLVPGNNTSGLPQVFFYREVTADDPLATSTGCKVAEGCCNEANGCYHVIFGKKPKTRPKDCIDRPRDRCKPPPT